jgi:hypothetical protein
LVLDTFTLNKTATVCGVTVRRSVALGQLEQPDLVQLVAQVLLVCRVQPVLKD